jgi:tetratricopeptide (TPR) repeat protein
MTHIRAPLLRIVALAAGLAGCFPFAAAAQVTPDAAQKSARANALVQAGKSEAAIPIYKELVAAFPAEPSFGTNLAIAQFKAGLYKDAILECHRLLRLRPDLFPALLFLGASHLKLGEASSAIQPLRQALSINPNDLNARIMLADALLAHQQPQEAADQSELAVRLMPDGPRAWTGLHRSYGAWSSELLSKLEKTAPGSAGLLALSGDFEKDRLQFARAFQCYRQALSLLPSLRGLHAKVAEIYELTGHRDWAAAERVRESATSCDSQSTECEFAAGRLREAAAATSNMPESLYWQGVATRALAQRAFERLQELPPSRERYEAAAESYERSARYREAALAWKQALALAPGDGEIQRRLALALCHANDCVSALPLLKDLLAKAPASAELNYLTGLALITTRNPEQALPYLEKAVRLDGEFVPAQASLGEALLEAGSPERAIPHLEAALAQDETGVRRYQLARALQAVGKEERAVAVLREYRAALSRRAASEKDEPRITAP